VGAQQVGALGTAVGMSSYLTGRALATRKWYIAKMEDYPRDRKAILPFLF
jgi:very-long-chain enoyl-CoA reductase